MLAPSTLLPQVYTSPEAATATECLLAAATVATRARSAATLRRSAGGGTAQTLARNRPPLPLLPRPAGSLARTVRRAHCPLLPSSSFTCIAPSIPFLPTKAVLVHARGMRT